jgi:hypothetical protein
MSIFRAHLKDSKSTSTLNWWHLITLVSIASRCVGRGSAQWSSWQSVSNPNRQYVWCRAACTWVVHLCPLCLITQILHWDSKWLKWIQMVDHVGLCWALATVRSKPKALFRVGMRRFLSWWSAMKDTKERCDRGNEGLKKADRNWGPKWTHEDIWSLFECWNMSTYVNIWKNSKAQWHGRNWMLREDCAEPSIPKGLEIGWATALSDSKSLLALFVCCLILLERSTKIA